MNVPEPLVLGTYPVLAIAYIAAYRHAVARTYYLVLVLALAGFGASIVVDLAVNTIVRETGLEMFLEDGSKLIGVGAWLSYFAYTRWMALAWESSGPDPEASGQSSRGRASTSAR